MFTLKGWTLFLLLIACCFGALELMLEQFGLVPCPGWLWSHHLRESCLVCVICRILGMTFEDVSLRVLSLIIDVFTLVLSSSITLTDIDV